MEQIFTIALISIHYLYTNKNQQKQSKLGRGQNYIFVHIMKAYEILFPMSFVFVSKAFDSHEMVIYTLH